MNRTEKYVANDRRKFLEMLTKAGISTKVLQMSALGAGIMADRYAAAAETNFSKRVIFVYTPDGAVKDFWLPTGSGTSMTLKMATKAYESVKQYCNFRSVNMKRGGGHGNTQTCMGSITYDQDWKGDSLDAQIGSIIGKTTSYPTIALGVQSNVGKHGLIGRRSGNPIPSEDSPSQAYKRFFGSAPPPGAGQGELAKEQSILDANLAGINALKAKLSSAEKARLDQHTAAIDAMSKRLADSYKTVVTAGCTAPQYNPNGYADPSVEIGNFHQTAELQSEIAVLALACGLTRVVTLQLGNHQAVWKGTGTKFTADHHGSCHAGSKEENSEMVNYLSQQVAYLIKRLAATPDPVNGGTMLDSTVVVQVTDMGNGQDHTPGDGPNMIATGTGFKAFKRGTSGTAADNEMMLAAVVAGLGLQAYEGMGITKFGTPADVLA